MKLGGMSMDDINWMILASGLFGWLLCFVQIFGVAALMSKCDCDEEKESFADDERLAQIKKKDY